MASKEHPVGVAQKKVLDALGLTAENWRKAEEMFEDLGIGVRSKRVGKTSVPVVTIFPRSGGGFNQDGEGETWDYGPFPTDIKAKLSEWIKE